MSLQKPLRRLLLTLLGFCIIILEKLISDLSRTPAETPSSYISSPAKYKP